jgi:hypothetical protein
MTKTTKTNNRTVIDVVQAVRTNTQYYYIRNKNSERPFFRLLNVSKILQNACNVLQALSTLKQQNKLLKNGKYKFV